MQAAFTHSHSLIQHRLHSAFLSESQTCTHRSEEMLGSVFCPLTCRPRKLEMKLLTFQTPALPPELRPPQINPLRLVFFLRKAYILTTKLLKTHLRKCCIFVSSDQLFRSRIKQNPLNTVCQIRCSSNYKSLSIRKAWAAEIIIFLVQTSKNSLTMLPKLAGDSKCIPFDNPLVHLAFEKTNRFRKCHID